MRFQNLDGLELHGVSLGAWRIDREGVAWGMAARLVCTPFSISYAQPEVIKTLDDLAFTRDVDLNDVNESVEAFAQLAEVLETVIKRQQEMLQRYPLPAIPTRFRPRFFSKPRRVWCPVALEIGTDSRNSINSEDIKYFIFGEPSHQRRSRRSSSRMLGTPIELPVGVSLHDQLLNDPDHKADRAAYIHACGKLATLLPRCTLSDWGSFTPGNDRLSAYAAKDRQLIELKKQLEDGDPEAHGKLRKYAANDGRSCGKNFVDKKEWSVFSWRAIIPTYHENERIQGEHPALGGYLKWHPDYLAAFYQSFHQTTRQSPYYRRPKLPIDPPNPPFVDPCADVVRAWIEQIDEGLSAPRLRDEKRLRGRLVRALAAKHALGDSP